MSCNSDLDVRRREISALVDGVVMAEQQATLPAVEGLYDDDKSEAMDILNRIERRIMAGQQPSEAAE
jgi:hypothetical protein